MANEAPSTSVQWRGRYLEAVRDGTWEYVRRVGQMSAAVVLAITDEGEAVLIEQHRPAVGASTLELVAGLIGDEGDAGGADPRATAERELMEETGYSAREWRYVGEFASSPGMSAEVFHLFIATGLARTGPGGGVGSEAIVTHLARLTDLAAFVAAKRAEGLVIDSRLIAFLPWANLA